MMIDVGYLAVVLGVILVSMTLHEAMHGYMAYFLGDDTAKAQGRLSLNPIKHIDPFLTIILPLVLAISGLPVFGGAKPVPFNPTRLRYGEWGMALVGVAGPLTNLLIAFVVFGIYVISGASPSSTLGGVLIIACYVNLGFFVFNMLPIPPLDGSRVLYALAPDFLRRILETVERSGLIVVFLLVLLASSFISVFMGSAINTIIAIFSRIFGV